MGGSNKSPAVKRGVVSDNGGTDGKYKTPTKDSTENLNETSVTPKPNKEKKQSPIKKVFTTLKSALPQKKVQGASSSNTHSPKGNINISQDQKVTIKSIMTIEEIRPRLENAIDRNFPYSVIGIINNNSKLINGAINSGNTEIMDLVIEAANVRAGAKGKTAYNIAKEKKDQKFLEVVDNTREQKKPFSVNLDDHTTHSNLLIQKSSSESSLVEPSRVIQKSKSNTDLNEVKATDPENLLYKLNRLVKKQNIYGILNLLIYNIELAYSVLESKDKVAQLITVNLLTKVANIQLEATGNTIFHLLASRKPITEDTEKTLELFLKLDFDKTIGIIRTAENSDKKTAYQIAKNKKNQEFLDTVDNACKKEKNELPTNAESNSTETQTNQPIMPNNTNLIHVDSKTLDNLSEVGSSFNELKNLDLENFLSELQRLIQNHTVHNIINIISYNLELINQELKDEKKDEIVELLIKAAYIQNEKEGNTIFHILVSHKNLSEKEIKVLELFNNLENVMPGAMEVANNKGETPLYVAEESGTSITFDFSRFRKLGTRENVQKKSEQLPVTQNETSNPFKDTKIVKFGCNNNSIGNDISQTEPQTPPKPFPRQSKQPTLNPELTPDPDSESDSGRGSDEETPKQFQVEEPQKEKSDKLEKPKLLIDGNNNNYGNKDTTLTKQSNNRNFYIALTAVCTLGTIACFATAAGLYFMSAKKTELAISSIAVIGALCVIGIGFTIAAVTTWRLTPSSEVESMSVHTFANGKQR